MRYFMQGQGIAPERTRSFTWLTNASLALSPRPCHSPKRQRCRVIATASRPETTDWVRKLGASHVADHRRPLDEAVKAIGFDGIDYLAAITSTPGSVPAIAAAMNPQGHITLIDNFDESILPFKAKSITISWEMMFTRSLFQTKDMDAQHRLLSEVSALVDAGVLRSTLTQNLGRISAENLRKAHAAIESGRVFGKVVLEGF